MAPQNLGLRGGEGVVVQGAIEPTVAVPLAVKMILMLSRALNKEIIESLTGRKTHT